MVASPTRATATRAGVLPGDDRHQGVLPHSRIVRLRGEVIGPPCHVGHRAAQIPHPRIDLWCLYQSDMASTLRGETSGRGLYAQVMAGQ